MTATNPADPTGEIPRLDSLPVRHLCDLHVELEPARVIGTPAGTRLSFIAKGGRVNGPDLKGEVLPGGGDWLRVGNDRVGQVDVRVTLRTEDGVLIHFESGGVVSVPDDGLLRLSAGEAIPFEETYIRTTPRFETSDERYSWLGRIVTIGYNAIAPDHVDYRIYQVL